MSNFADVVSLKTGYANFVELKSAFEESKENADRMAMYRPTTAHRQAFERICRGLYKPNDKKFYLLSGSYGTGKSHLCLMAANVLSRSSEDIEIKGFYENYAKLDAEKAKMLKNVRKNGQYLVAICDYHQGRKFEDVVLRAVFEACEERDFDAGIQTEFDEAERQLEKWEKEGGAGHRDFYKDFDSALSDVAPGTTMEQLRNRLKKYDSEALEAFRESFKTIMGGIEFQAQSGNLIPILRSLVRSDAFKERFRGLAILFDEFGFTLEKAAYSKDVLQGFMETICKSEPNVMFVGCIHKDFKAYADRFSQDDAAVMSARLTQVDLLNEGIEEIIGAIVETHKENDTWKKEIEPKVGVFDQLVPPCKTLNLFPWIKDINRIRQRVLEDIYGVHPMALSCLLRLSSEIGSDARSTFTFFSGDVGGGEGSYADFIKTSDIITKSGKLNLYTVNQLYTFFKKELSLKNPELRERQRQLVNGFYASLESFKKSLEGDLLGLEKDERVGILQTILIYQLCQIPTSLENIQFGLYCLNNSEKKQVESQLKDLSKKGVIFFRQQSKTYELAVSSGEDPYDLIDRFLSDTDNHPPDITKALLEEGASTQDSDFMEAKNYNLVYSEDKRLKIYYLPAKDLSETRIKEISQDIDITAAKEKQSYEGALIYALCESDTDIKLAKDSLGFISDRRIAIAVPHAPTAYTDLVLRVKACRHFLPPNETVKLSAQTESRLRDILDSPDDGHLTNLKRAFTSISEGANACWYSEESKVLVDKPKQPHRPADLLCEKLYDRRSKVKHADLNSIHDDRWRTGKNGPLKQAVELLLHADRVHIDNGNPDNHGQKRYLERVLLKGAGALKKTKTDGSITYYDCDIDPGKLSKDIPILTHLCESLVKLDPGQTLSIGTQLHDYRQPPFGAGGTLLMLATAHVLRGYGERLVVYTDSTKSVSIAISDYDTLKDIVADPNARHVFEVRSIETFEVTFVDQVAQAAGAEPLKHGELRTLRACVGSLKEWWSQIPTAAKNIDIYPEGDRARLQRLQNILNEITISSDSYDIILRQIPQIYLGDSPLAEKTVKSVVKSISADMKTYAAGFQHVKTLIASSLCDIFGASGDMVELEKAIDVWYKSLDPKQRDFSKYDEEETSQMLLHMSDDSIGFDTKILSSIPRNFGLGEVKDWSTLKVDDLVAKVRQAKDEIETARPEVAKPILNKQTYELASEETVIVKIPKGAVELTYTTNGVDPRFSSEANRSKDPIDLGTLLKEHPRINVALRALDTDGNASDIVRCQITSKERKHEIEIKPDLIDGNQAIFRWPNDKKSLLAVFRSILKFAEQQKIISHATASKIHEVMQEMLTKE